jgi:prepilin-type N-terminal cleavage/methylation domain-containing protein
MQHERDTGRRAGGEPGGRGRAAFTLVEVLVTVVVLAIAATLVIPSMSQTDILRVQGAVRHTVADITFAQTDAMAYQARRAIWFNRVPNDPDDSWVFGVGNGYTLAEVTGPIMDLSTNAMFHPDEPGEPYSRRFDDGDFGSARIDSSDFDGDELLIFDELGGPVQSLTGEEASAGGRVRITGGVDGQWAYDILIAPMTGRVNVVRIDLGE